MPHDGIPLEVAFQLDVALRVALLGTFRDGLGLFFEEPDSSGSG